MLARREKNFAYSMNWEIKCNWGVRNTVSPSVSLVGDQGGKPYKIYNTVEPLIMVTTAEWPPPDLQSVKKVPAEFRDKLS